MARESVTGRIEDRVDAWFTRVLDYVGQAGGRTIRTGSAGPVSVSHTFQPDTSHAPLLDALLTSTIPQPTSTGAGQLRVHSIEAPPTSLMTPSPVSEADLDGRPAPRALQGSRWRLTWDASAGVVRCFDRVRGEGVFITAGPVELWELGAPFRSFLHWYAAASGSALVHAGTVGTPDGMGLVLGQGGTGKSTTVLTGLDAGLQTCGDDYVWLEPHPAGTTVHALYGTIKTKPDSTWRAPDEVRQLVVDGGSKTIHWLAATAPHTFVDRAELRSVVVLVTPGESAAGSAAHAAAAASTAFQLPYDATSTLAVLSRALRGLSRIEIPRIGDHALVARTLVTRLGSPDGDTSGVATTHA